MNVVVISYVAFFVGVGIWQYQTILWCYLSLRNRIIIKRDLRKITKKLIDKDYGKVSSHIKRAIAGAQMTSVFTSPEVFYGFSLTCAMGTFCLVVMTEGFEIALVFSALVGMLPYGVVMSKLHKQRVVSSREGDIMVQELLNNYKIYSFNIKEAVEVTSATLKNAPNARRILLNLAKGLNNAITKDEVNAVLTNLKYSIDTTWGNALATNIFFAHVYGIRVDNALEDLSNGITKSRQVLEHSRRENNEANLMLKYLAPISYLLTVIGACKFFGFTFEKFIRYQFASAIGLRWFMIMALLYIGGILLNGLLSQEKMDI